MTAEFLNSLATVVGALCALFGFPLVLLQLREAQRQRTDAIRLSTSQVLFAADAVLATHADVAAKLRPRGDWAGDEGKVHPTNDELQLVEPYLGVFERIFIAYQAGQVDAATLDALYGYRLANIWANERIVRTKLENPCLKGYWTHFIALSYVLEAYHGKPFPLHTDTYFPAGLFNHECAQKILGRRETGQKLN